MQGHLHPVTQFFRKVIKSFKELGFEIVEGPEKETEWYNFDSLRMPDDHPARDIQDTFWLKNGEVMRTHTSASQVRTMEKRTPPARIVVPGRCFRRENTDASHEHTFYQLEGMVIDKNITVANMIGTLEEFAKKIFGKNIKFRVRTNLYPFVEPGFDIDITCTICKGKGCNVCKQTGWLEVMPCGMIHPIVLKNMGIDPKKYSGFAFAFGIDRLVMLEKGVKDIRLFYSSDLRFLKQF